MAKVDDALLFGFGGSEEAYKVEKLIRSRDSNIHSLLVSEYPRRLDIPTAERGVTGWHLLVNYSSEKIKSDLIELYPDKLDVADRSGFTGWHRMAAWGSHSNQTALIETNQGQVGKD